MPNTASSAAYTSNIWGNAQETGHTSYKCPHNVLGDRAKPKKKQRNVEEESENVKAWLENDEDDF